MAKCPMSHITGQGEMGEVPTAETLGALTRKVLSNSRQAESRELARAVLLCEREIVACISRCCPR